MHTWIPATAVGCLTIAAILYSKPNIGTSVVRVEQLGLEGHIDYIRYASRAYGVDVGTPFHRRWLVPLLLAKKPDRMWRWMTYASLLALAPLITSYAAGPWWAAVLLLMSLPIVRHNIVYHGFVDPPAMALALGAAVAWKAGHAWLAVVLSLLSGATKETGPVFAACYALAPELLVGLLAVQWWPQRGATLALPNISGSGQQFVGPFWHAIRAIRQAGAHQFFMPSNKLFPWGALAILAPWQFRNDSLTLSAALSLAIGYAQCIIATDNARIYQWAAPPVVALACQHDPRVLAVACVLHWFNNAQSI